MFPGANTDHQLQLQPKPPRHTKGKPRLIAVIIIVGVILGLALLTASMTGERSSTVQAQSAPVAVPTDPPAVPTQSNPVGGSDEPIDAPYATPFSDVKCNPFDSQNPSDYFCLSSTFMTSQGWISGYSDGTFRPWNSTTRAQVSKIIVKAKAWTTDTTGGPHFSDVPTSNPFYIYIETAYNHEIISGYSDGTFRPYNNFARGQFTKMIVLAQQWPTYTPASPTFQDEPTSDAFYNFVETAYHYGIISGYSCGDGCLQFHTYDNVKRGQITKMVYEAVMYIRVTSWGLSYGHQQQSPTPGSNPGVGVHQGSNNYQCTGTNGYRCTQGTPISPPGYFLVQTATGGANFYTLQANDLKWSQSAIDFLQTQQMLDSINPVLDAIVFHAFKWDDSNSCTNGLYSSVYSDFPNWDSSDYFHRYSCGMGNPDNEVRIPVRHPGQLQATQIYHASMRWSTNTDALGAYYPGQLTVDNYLVGADNLSYNPVNEFMVKFCYQLDTIGQCP